MPLNVRSISVSGAVICFFVIAAIGWISGFSTYTCCTRALTAAIIAYVVITVAVKAINAILINAVINNWVGQEKETTRGSAD